MVHLPKEKNAIIIMMNKTLTPHCDTIIYCLSFVVFAVFSCISCFRQLDLPLSHYKTPPLLNLCLKLCHVYVPGWRPRQRLSGHVMLFCSVLLSHARQMVVCRNLPLPVRSAGHLSFGLQCACQNFL